MAKTKSKIHRTPAGGVRSKIFYLDSQRRLVDERHATHAEIVEYDKHGRAIQRTYGVLGKGHHPPKATRRRRR